MPVTPNPPRGNRATHIRRTTPGARHRISRHRDDQDPLDRYLLKPICCKRAEARLRPCVGAAWTTLVLTDELEREVDPL